MKIYIFMKKIIKMVFSYSQEQNTRYLLLNLKIYKDSTSENYCKGVKENKAEHHHQSSIDLSVPYLGQVQNIARINSIIRLWRLPFAPSALAPYPPSRKLRVRCSKSSGSRICKSFFWILYDTSTVHFRARVPN